MRSPTTDEIAALLTRAGITAADASRIVCVSKSSITRAISGEQQMSPQLYQLLQLMLSAAARRELPDPLIRD